MFSANIILHSKSHVGAEVVTFLLRYPRIIHAELMTHRVFTRNASSSRAVPVRKLISEVWNKHTRATPIFWGKNKAGMSAKEELTGFGLWTAQTLWGVAARFACIIAWLLVKANLHKQIANRVLEPFSHINVVVSATDFYNFFGLRLDADAQPEIQFLAQLMFAALEHSEPQLLKEGDWHLPFVSIDDRYACMHKAVTGAEDPDQLALDIKTKRATELMVQVSTSRLGRTSYTSFETGKRSTIEEDIKLYAKLVGSQPVHASPAEHVCRADGKRKDGRWKNPRKHGNFVGFIQHRKEIEGEDLAPLPEKYRNRLKHNTELAA